MPQVFLSYAWADNRPRFEGLKWVSKFCELLSDRLRQVSGIPINIWMAANERRGDELSQIIKDAIHTSDLFIALCSPSYVTDESCQRELKQFIKQKSQTLGLSESEAAGKYVLKVVKLQNNQIKWPRLLDNYLTEHHFYKERKSNSWEELIPNDNNYLELIHDLSWDIHTYFQESAKLVFISTASGSQTNSYRRRLIKELDAQGFGRLPDDMIPKTVEEAKEFIRYCLNQSILSVHILGTDYGTEIEDTGKSIQLIQYEVAKNFASKKQPLVIWLDRNMQKQTVEKKQNEFIDEIWSDGNFYPFEIIEDSFENFNNELKDLLKTIEDD